MVRQRWELTAAMVFMLVLSAACSIGSNGNDANSSAGSSYSAHSAAGDKTSLRPVELRMAWWGSQERHDKTIKVIELFERKYPHIRITGEYSGFDGYFDKLNTQIAASNAPDLIQMGGNIREYVDRGALQPLDPYAGRIIYVEDLAASLIKEATFGEKFYGVSLGVTATGLLYNAELFNKAGIAVPPNNWSYDDFKSVMTQISEKLGTGFYGSYDLSGSKNALGDYLISNGKTIYKDGRISFDEADITGWFRYWDDLRKAGAIVPPEVQVANSPDAADKSLLVKGEVAIHSISASQIFGYQQVTEDTLGLLPSPVGSTGTNGMSPPMAGQFLTVYAKTAHPEEAAMFVDFMVNDPEAAAILGNTRGVPSSGKIRDALALQSTPVDKELYDYVSLVSDLASFYEYEIIPFDNEFIELLKVTSENIAFGQLSIEAAVDLFMLELDKIVERTQ